MPARENLNLQPLSDSTLRVIGKGMSFPFQFGANGRTTQVNLESGIRKINQSIHMILSTRPGERLFLPEYGSRLPELVFEPNDDVLYILLNIWTADALRRWEPRIQVVGVTAFDPVAMKQRVEGSPHYENTGLMGATVYGIDPHTFESNTVGIQIDYIIKQYHAPASYVYPFKLGGMPLSETVQRTF